MTAVGQEMILARIVSHNGKPYPYEVEKPWVLRRDWREMQ